MCRPLLLSCLLAGSLAVGPATAASFERTASRVSGFEGQTVYLPCRVRNLGDKLVSWMRGRDLHILSSGELSFSSDRRFKAQHLEGSDAWSLRLERLRRSDAGAYECQVSSEPKIMRRLQLIVWPVAAVLGPRELRVERQPPSSAAPLLPAASALLCCTLLPCIFL